MLQIAGNCAAVTDRSFAVPDGVNNGQYGVGIVIDFFGLAGKYSGFPVEFHYPTVTAVVPANIALVAGGKNNDEAKKFISFTLSREGQELLFDPKISRLPILPNASFGAKVPAGYPDAHEIAKRAKVQFDSHLSSDRYQVVVSLFDQMVTFRLKDLQAATKAIHEAERKLKAKPNAQAAELLKQARSFAYSPLVSDSHDQGRGVPRAVPQEQEGRGRGQAAHRPGRPVEHQGQGQLRQGARAGQARPRPSSSKAAPARRRATVRAGFSDPRKHNICLLS
jgi:phosphoglycerate transport regulatory protein PgtC